jgi:hypothetical protein
MWRARPTILDASPEHLIRSYLYRVQRRSDRFANWQGSRPHVRIRPLAG